MVEITREVTPSFYKPFKIAVNILRVLVYQNLKWRIISESIIYMHISLHLILFIRSTNLSKI
jgi:hypothetical protein